MMNQHLFRFRVWDTYQKQFIDFGVGSLRSDYTLNDIFEDNFNDGDRYIVQQFTGLIDSTGKEIYEGDIVDYRHKGMDNFEEERYADLLVSPVFWDYERWRIKYSAASYAWHLMKVVGNAYETPELLQPCSKN